MSLRIIFMGTPDFSVPALKTLLESGHTIVGVYCQPPKPAGRGLQLKKSAVHTFAESLGLPVFTPKTLRAEDSQQQFTALNADVAVVVAYGLLLPKPILEAPREGCINIHGSLLPRWRGAAPIQRALLAGDTETGITTMRMDEGLDTGPMLLKAATSITEVDTAQTLHDRLSLIGAALIQETLLLLEQKQLVSTPQPCEGVTYAAKLTRSDSLLDWSQDAHALHRQYRALHPWPGIHFGYEGEEIKVLHLEKVEGSGTPGQILSPDLCVACGEGAVRLVKVQRPGKTAVSGADFMNGMRLKRGDSLNRAAL
ncbi:MAG: methionyl-tRNA formyltransferase [Holosporales bacterium]